MLKRYPSCFRTYQMDGGLGPFCVIANFILGFTLSRLCNMIGKPLKVDRKTLQAADWTSFFHTYWLLVICSNKLEKRWRTSLVNTTLLTCLSVNTTLLTCFSFNAQGLILFFSFAQLLYARYGLGYPCRPVPFWLGAVPTRWSPILRSRTKASSCGLWTPS